MKNMKILAVVGVAVVVLAAVAVISGVSKKKQEPDILASESLAIESRADEMGIHYGGTFNEFEYQPDGGSENAAESDTSELESSGEVEQSETMTEDMTTKDKAGENGLGDDEDIEVPLEQIKDDFEKEKENGRINAEKIDGLQLADNQPSTVQEDSSQDSNAEESLEDDGTELQLSGIPIYKSKGYAEHEVICDAETQEQAEQIAARISGTLLSWENNVATIQIEGSVDDLLDQMDKEGSDLYLYRKYYY